MKRFCIGLAIVWFAATLAGSDPGAAPLMATLPWWVPYLIYIVLFAVSYMLMPRPKTATPVAPKPYGIDDIQVPTASAGREIPVVFGTRWVNSPNVVWYGDLAIEKKRETSCT